jgi:phosphonopyruvate decarboxylase
MVDCGAFHATLLREGIRFFAGVPDSLLKDFCAFVAANTGRAAHVITPNEGHAVALVAGHHLATGRMGLVYMQNSGIGNAVNPLLSLADPQVCGIPMLLLIGWRGQPGHPDEPQHLKQGRVTLPLLETMGLPHRILPGTDPEAAECIALVADLARRRPSPAAVVVSAGTFAPYSPGDAPAPGPYALSREDVIDAVVGFAGPDDAIVATTGKASRELFECRIRRQLDPGCDFLTVGAMGHASHVALGIALAQPGRRVYCLDGDGSVLMHMGALAAVGASDCANYVHVVLNNGAHESVGGQATLGFRIDLCAIARGCGYRWVGQAIAGEDVVAGLATARRAGGPALLEVRVKASSRADLGRPAAAPSRGKEAFMRFLAGAGP